MLTFNEGDIVLAPFRFMEEEGAKLRPCLVWKITPVAVVLVYISSQHVSQTSYVTEVGLSLDEAREIGLLKGSRIDFRKRDMCLPSDVGRILGTISALPRKKLRACANAADAAGLFVS